VNLKLEWQSAVGISESAWQVNAHEIFWTHWFHEPSPVSYHSVMMFQGVAKAAPFARNGFSGFASVELNVDLRMSSASLSPSLN
jgi:hypothetical protein